MKIKDIYESTTSGSIATVSSPMTTQSRNASIYGGKQGGNLLTGKKTNKKYANSKVNESKKPVQEADLQEDDLILVPGQGNRLKSGFIPHGESRLDHEVEMARSDLFSAAKNAKQVYELIADLTEEEGLEGWVQEKIIKANDYLNTVREYLEGKELQQQEMTGGVIAAGGVGEAQSMGAALKNTLAKAEPGSKLDNSIKSHNRHIKAGLPGTLKNAPTGYHFDSKGYCRLGDK